MLVNQTLCASYLGSASSGRFESVLVDHLKVDEFDEQFVVGDTMAIRDDSRCRLQVHKIWLFQIEEMSG